MLPGPSSRFDIRGTYGPGGSQNSHFAQVQRVAALTRPAHPLSRELHAASRHEPLSLCDPDPSSFRKHGNPASSGADGSAADERSSSSSESILQLSLTPPPSRQTTRVIPRDHVISAAHEDMVTDAALRWESEKRHIESNLSALGLSGPEPDPHAAEPTDSSYRLESGELALVKEPRDLGLDADLIVLEAAELLLALRKWHVPRTADGASSHIDSTSDHNTTPHSGASGRSASRPSGKKTPIKLHPSRKRSSTSNPTTGNVLNGHLLQPGFARVSPARAPLSATRKMVHFAPQDRVHLIAASLSDISREAEKVNDAVVDVDEPRRSGRCVPDVADPRSGLVRPVGHLAQVDSPPSDRSATDASQCVVDNKPEISTAAPSQSDIEYCTTLHRTISSSGEQARVLAFAQLHSLTTDSLIRHIRWARWYSAVLLWSIPQMRSFDRRMLSDAFIRAVSQAMLGASTVASPRLPSNSRPGSSARSSRVPTVATDKVQQDSAARSGDEAGPRRRYLVSPDTSDDECGPA